MTAWSRAAILLALLALSARAGAASCSVSAQALAFGSYDPLFLLPTDSNGQVTVDCTSLLPELVTYTLSLSTGGSGQYAERRMSSGSGPLPYNLYADVTRLSVWGDGTGGTVQVQNAATVTLLGYSSDHTVYGRIPALQNVAPGAYADTIVVTLEY